MNALATGTVDAIKIRSLVKRFGAFTAVKDVNISVPAGSFLVLVGPSGCGKSTLLRMLAGLESPSEGEIAFVGQTVSSGAGGVIADAGKRNAGLVFQSYALWPHMTVAGNIGYGLRMRGIERHADFVLTLPIGKVEANGPAASGDMRRDRIASRGCARAPQHQPASAAAIVRFRDVHTGRRRGRDQRAEHLRRARVLRLEVDELDGGLRGNGHAGTA